MREPAISAGWLIEYGDSSPAAPLYLAIVNRIGQWTPDHIVALRFARQQDAEAYASTLGGTPVRVAEHQWG